MPFGLLLCGSGYKRRQSRPAGPVSRRPLAGANDSVREVRSWLEFLHLFAKFVKLYHSRPRAAVLRARGVWLLVEHRGSHGLGGEASRSLISGYPSLSSSI